MDLRLLNKLRESLRSEIENQVKHDQLSPELREDMSSIEEIENRCYDRLVNKLVKMAMEVEA